MKNPKDIVDLMMSGDYFSQWMKVTVVEVGLGECTLECVTHKGMLNGFSILHGGITYSLSDSALAFASNSYGYKCVSIETSISHILPVREGEKLLISCNELHRGKSIAIYNVEIFNSSEQIVSKFKGTVNISKEIW